MPPAKEKIELVWWGQNFQQPGNPIQFNIRHLTPFGDQGGFNVKGNDMTISEEDLITAARTAAIVLDSPAAIADAIIAHVKATHWADPAQAVITRATGAVAPGQPPAA